MEQVKVMNKAENQSEQSLDNFADGVFDLLYDNYDPERLILLIRDIYHECYQLAADGPENEQCSCPVCVGKVA